MIEMNGNNGTVTLGCGTKLVSPIDGINLLLFLREKIVIGKEREPVIYQYIISEMPSGLKAALHIA
jgi:hypothetical protein